MVEVQAAASAGAPRVLVVDDYRDAAELAAIVLQKAGFEVGIAYGGHDALAMAAWFIPEVAVLDIAMPDMDGHAVAAALRALPGVAGCKMVALTGQDDAATREKSMAAGFSSHLVKPAEPSALVRAVRAITIKDRTSSSGPFGEDTV